MHKKTAIAPRLQRDVSLSQQTQVLVKVEHSGESMFPRCVNVGSASAADQSRCLSAMTSLSQQAQPRVLAVTPTPALASLRPRNTVPSIPSATQCHSSPCHCASSSPPSLLTARQTVLSASRPRVHQHGLLRHLVSALEGAGELAFRLPPCAENDQEVC
jgi:hypothetical protein